MEFHPAIAGSRVERQGLNPDEQLLRKSAGIVSGRRPEKMRVQVENSGRMETRRVKRVTGPGIPFETLVLIHQRPFFRVIGPSR